LQQVLERTPDLPEENGPSPAIIPFVFRENAKAIMAGLEGKSKGTAKKILVQYSTSPIRFAA
jgi:hypothetical protein